jgi:GTP-binding protein EngB required for normal cell division
MKKIAFGVRNNAILFLSLRYIDLYLYMSPSNNREKMRQQTNKPAKRHLNLVVVGKAGVGKSSFLNYAAGRKVFQTGNGDPMTQNYFEQIEVNSALPGITYSLFDTKGLVSDNIDEWTDSIFSEIERRDSMDDIYSWLHTIIYCVSAVDSTIEDFEVKAIKRLMERGKVSVVITKKDLISIEQLDALKQQIYNKIGSSIQIIAVCNGTHHCTEPASGLAEVLRAGFIGLWEKAAKIVPARALDESTRELHRVTCTPTLSNLVASMALAGTTGVEFPTLFSVFRMAGLPTTTNQSDFLSTERISTEFYEMLCNKSHFKLREASANKVVLNYITTFHNALSLPQVINRNALQYRYYQQGLQAWAERWGATVDRLLSAISSGRFKDAFIRRANNTVSEILKFYNDITHNNKPALAQHKTEEMLDAIPEIIDIDIVRSQIADSLLNLRNSISTVEHCLMFSRSERIETANIYAGLAREMRNLNDALIDAFRHVAHAFETELHAYGLYCLQEDDQSNTNNGAGRELVRRLVYIAQQNGEQINSKERRMIETVAVTYGISSVDVDKMIAEMKADTSC